MTTAESLPRTSVPVLDELLGRPLPCLDDGFVRVVDYMGSDGAVVQAARVSYGAGTKRLREDRGLIRYLMRHQHTTPFEMCEIKLHVRVPMDCWRQWIRHRTANVNEYSTRSSVAIDAAHRTAPEAWRLQAKRNRQGSGGIVDSNTGHDLTREETELLESARRVYERRLAEGVAREQARKDLPLSTYTEAYWKVDLHNLLHFLHLRMDAHAQWEIRQYATIIGEQIVAKWCPITWEAFLDYRLGGTKLSSLETDVVEHISKEEISAAMDLLNKAGMLKRKDGQLLRNRERDELQGKLERLGLQAPWVRED